MESLTDSLAFWSSILGTLVGLVGFFRSSRWLAVGGVVLVAASVASLLYARKQRLRLRMAAVKIEGRSIDALNAASLTRRLNRSLVVQEAEQTAAIVLEDLMLTWRYSGYCRAARETVIEFSVDTDTHIPFAELECFAYDLHHDPKRTHRIRPVLIGADGLSKKIAVPFLGGLSAREPFNVVLTCTLPGCMRRGVEYYTSTMSLAQESVPRSTVRLVFLDGRPDWLRVYECGPQGTPKLLKDLRPSRESALQVEYMDVAADVPAQSARIYMFRRSGALDRAA